ncbi:hypothetical protein A0H76_2368 [Hepatospora eriocheir]|uniref:Uncharacterized protein n=1 Tax=Hepatospora eriocheir TaxID=1081669 RepID=A0A1X0QFS4_9MICR|nr:hypothetical protein A0H76_2368 [Hepatospora eriocheir]
MVGHFIKICFLGFHLYAMYKIPLSVYTKEFILKFPEGRFKFGITALNVFTVISLMFGFFKFIRVIKTLHSYLLTLIISYQIGFTVFYWFTALTNPSLYGNFTDDYKSPLLHICRYGLPLLMCLMEPFDIFNGKAVIYISLFIGSVGMTYYFLYGLSSYEVVLSFANNKTFNEKFIVKVIVVSLFIPLIIYRLLLSLSGTVKQNKVILTNKK